MKCESSLTNSGINTYGYTSENLMKSGPGGPTLYYDPAGRLSEYDTSVSTRFVYTGSQIASELNNNGSNTLLRRYVWGPGSDVPLVWYEGTGTADRRWLATDERGSVVAITNASGALIASNSYDDYGIPASTNLGRFQYTGQAWLPEIGLYEYKARMYSPTLGRFMQTDPIGYGDGPNWYNYVGSDPINHSDPLGLDTTVIGNKCPSGICITDPGSIAQFIQSLQSTQDRFSFGPSQNDGSGGGGNDPPPCNSPGADQSNCTIVVTATPPKCDLLCQLKQFIGLGRAFVCHAPAMSGGMGVDTYEVVGGSATVGASLNPRNGQMSVSVDVGLGFGGGDAIRQTSGPSFAGGVSSASSEPAPTFQWGLNANLAGTFLNTSGSASYQLLGNSTGDKSFMLGKGEGAAGFGNIGPHVQVNLPALYNWGC